MRSLIPLSGFSLALRQIVFSVWATLNEQKWVTLRERRGRCLRTDPLLFAIRAIKHGSVDLLDWDCVPSVTMETLVLNTSDILEVYQCARHFQLGLRIARPNVTSPVRVPMTAAGESSVPCTKVYLPFCEYCQKTAIKRPATTISAHLKVRSTKEYLLGSACI